MTFDDVIFTRLLPGLVTLMAMAKVSSRPVLMDPTNPAFKSVDLEVQQYLGKQVHVLISLPRQIPIQ